MKRRNLLAGFACLTGAGKLTLGSGAFSNATAEREVKVALESDAEAVLRISPADAGVGRAEQTDGTVEFAFPGDDEEFGLNVDAIFQFGTSGTGMDPDTFLFTMTNEGTETVELTDDQLDSAPDTPEVGIFDVTADPNDEGLKPLLRDDPVVLAPGELVYAGIQIDTFDFDADSTYETSVVIKVNGVN